LKKLATSLFIAVLSFTAIEFASVATEASGKPKATTILAKLQTKGRAPKTGYDRALFSDGWGDIGDCDTRNYILKRDLTNMAKWLFVGVLVLMVASIINIFVGSSTGMLVISVLSIGIFSAFMLYDIKRIIDGGETNYISATLALYMNAINIFQSLLAILGIMGGERE
jgi:hypothetical protein